MGFFFRRSTKIGPFRLNFSKSGIGASVGVKGARLTMTPRGTTYITAGGHGFYYRETLSTRSRRSMHSPTTLPPAASSYSDAIPTADVTDLVDSSQADLIRTLNERARMFNPAWLIYLVSLALGLCSCAVFANSSNQPLPDVKKSSFDEQRTAIDDYVALVARYGYPESVIVSDGPGNIPVRVANFAPANLKAAFVPRGCVEAYFNAARSLVDKKKYPALAKKKTADARECSTASNGKWSIVAFNVVDLPGDGAVSSDIAKIRLDSLTSKRSSPPSIEVEKNNIDDRRKDLHNRAAKTVEPKIQETVAETWSVPDTTLRNSESAAKRILYWTYALLFAGAGTFVLGVLAHKRNTEQRTSRLFYELTDEENQKYSIVQDAFAHLSKAQQLWRIEARSGVTDWKHNAGASSLVRRASANIGVSTPFRVRTNMAVPTLNLGSAQLFFFPDVVLYLERGVFGGIAYDDFHVEQHPTRFIEDDAVPGDARVVDRTWRYVNKNGGPDRRFKNNVQLPIVLYGAVTLTSSHGLNIHLDASNLEESQAFAECWRVRKSRSTKIASNQAVPDTSPSSRDSLDPQACKVLGVDMKATSLEITAAYHRLAQMYHPDKVAGLAPEFQALAEQRMKEINNAYAILKGRT